MTTHSHKEWERCDRRLAEGADAVEEEKMDRTGAAVLQAAQASDSETGNLDEIRDALEVLSRSADAATASRARAALDALRQSGDPLSFRTLGAFEVRRGGRLLTGDDWGRPMAAKLVRFLLVARPEAVHEEVIIDALWPDKDVAAARKNLQVTLARARTALEGGDRPGTIIQVSNKAYRLALSDRDAVDAEVFEAAVRGALAARADDRRPKFESAALLWQGDPLPEDRYEDWALGWRERLNDRYLDLLAALLTEVFAQGDCSAAIEVGREMVRVDPHHEHAHRSLMKALAKAGRRGEALKQFLDCRRRLIKELGIEPARETAALHEQILAGESI